MGAPEGCKQHGFNRENVKWKMLLFCVKTIVKDSRKFELAHLKKKKKKKKI